MNKDKPELLNLLIVTMLLNAALTGIHYVLILQGIIPNRTMNASQTIEFAVADTFATIIPSLLGAYGLWRLKRWGLVMAALVSGGYIHGMIALLTRSTMASQLGMMSFVSVYIILFSILFVTYLWRQRAAFT